MRRSPDVARLLDAARRFGAALSSSCASRSRRLGRCWLAASRVALAFLALYALALLRGDVPALRAHWRDYLVVGIVNTALPFALFSFAAQHVTASTAAILNATSPFFATIVAALWLKDRVTPAKIIGHDRLASPASCCWSDGSRNRCPRDKLLAVVRVPGRRAVLRRRERVRQGTADRPAQLCDRALQPDDRNDRARPRAAVSRRRPDCDHAAGRGQRPGAWQSHRPRSPTCSISG